MSNPGSKVTLIVPTLNEIEGMEWFMPQLKQEWYEELIVIDGESTDGTVEYCNKNNYPVVFQSGKGLARATDDAFAHSTKDIIIFVTPDGNSLPELIPQLVAKMKEGYDMVIVSRYLGNAKSYDDDFITAFGNKMFTKMVNVFFKANYTDSLVIYRAYRRDAILKMGLHKQEGENRIKNRFSTYVNSWELGSSIRDAKLIRVAEIPGDEPKRIGGNRNLSIIKHGFGALYQIFYELFASSKFKEDV